MCTSLLPIDPMQKAVALSMSDVLNAKPSRRKQSETPFSLAFFKHYFDTKTPSKAQINVLIRGNMNKHEAITVIDRFILSNGEHRCYLIARKASPDEGGDTSAYRKAVSLQKLSFSERYAE